jgi:hypothetical protein
VTYKEAATAAQNADQAERAQLARRKAAELESKLSTLTIVVPAAADRPDLQIKRDGDTIGRPGWGVAIPVDPGMHTVEASAPGRKVWQGQATVEGAGVQATLEVPPLVEAPAEPPMTAPTAGTAAPATPSSSIAAAPEVAPPTAHGTAQRAGGLVTGAVGVAGLIVGTTFGAIARADNNDAKKNCLVDSACNPQGYASSTSAEHAATASTVAFIAGGALVAAGLVVYLTAPPSSPRSARIGLTPMVAEAATGVALHGGW